MLPINKKSLLVCLAAGWVSACNSPMPCGNGKLCASLPPITSAGPAPEKPARPALAPKSVPLPVPEPPAEVQVYAIDMGGGPGAHAEPGMPPLPHTTVPDEPPTSAAILTPQNLPPPQQTKRKAPVARPMAPPPDAAILAAMAAAPAAPAVSTTVPTTAANAATAAGMVAPMAPAAMGAMASAGDTSVAPGAALGGPPGDVLPPYRIGLLLPLRSDALRHHSEALRAGFMAAWERDRQGVVVTVIETGDVPQDVLSSYASALEQQDMIVGPLARSAVATIAASPLVSKPTIALSTPENRDAAPLPQQMLVIGLSIEDEAHQTADWAGREQPGAIAYVLSGVASWQRRSATAFAAQWQRQGMAYKTIDMNTLNGYLSDSDLVALRTRLQAEPSTVVFAALDPDQARQLRRALAAPPLGEVPIYGTSTLNPGRGKLVPGQDMDGVRLLDLPWQLQRDHPAVMVYPQLGNNKPDADIERLYALGIDAFRVAREIASKQELLPQQGRKQARAPGSTPPPARFNLDGVTGRLDVSFGDGPSRFERHELPAVYKNGVPVPVTGASQP